MKNNLFVNWNNIAHRGIHNKEIPENSLLAFKKAIENNYAIELDVHLLKDGNIVVFHDDNLKRMTNINKKIKDCTYEELKKISLLNSKEKIPLFTDVLKLINGKVPLLIELKYDLKVSKLEKEIIKILKLYNGEYYFQSFRLKSLLYMKIKTRKKVGLLISSKPKKTSYFLLKKLILKILRIDFISYPLKKINHKEIKQLKNKIPILIWTIKNEKDLKKAKKLADQIIFENLT